MAYLPLSTANLPDPVIDPAQGASPEDYFNTVLYTGTGASGNAQDVGFSPDLLWMKPRDQARDHRLIDVLRGNAVLSSNDTDAEITGGDMIVNSTGFEFTSGSSNYNGSTNTYVSWNWKANGSGVSNTDGSITSTVSANTTSGFSIVTYTGTGSLGNVGHGLDQKPQMIMFKRRTGSSTADWNVYHESVTATGRLKLNTTDATQTTSTPFNNTEPTDSLFTVNTATQVNPNGDTVIAYCFHSVDGFSKFGSYVGNGSSDGPFVYTGFRPSWILIKQSSASGERWWVHDTAREEYNNDIAALAPDFSGAEETGTVYQLDTLSNGFKLRNSHAVQNSSGATYIYACFSENPFKYSNAR